MMDKIDKIYRKINQLYRLRVMLLKRPLARPDIWISQYVKMVGTQCYTYAKWESVTPIFKSKKDPEKKTRHEHIGRAGSTTGLSMDESVRIAYRLQRHRRWLDRVETAIGQIESAIDVRF